MSELLKVILGILLLPFAIVLMPLYVIFLFVVMIGSLSFEFISYILACFGLYTPKDDDWDIIP